MASITHNTKQGPPSMTTSAATPAIRLRARSLKIDLRIGYLRLLAVVNGLILLSVLWLLTPSSPMGTLGPLMMDIEAAQPMMSLLAIRGTVAVGIGFLLGADVSQSMRRLPASYKSLFSLSGQALLFVITLVYVAKGRLPLLALYGHGSVLALSAVGIVAIVQSYQASRRYDVRSFLYPILSAIMTFLGIALVLSPDTATRQLFEVPGGVIPFLLFLASLAWGSGQLRINHLSPDKMSRRLIPLMIYPVLSVRLLVIGRPVSIMGVLLIVSVGLLAAFWPFLQADIERIEQEREKERQAQLQQEIAAQLAIGQQG